MKDDTQEALEELEQALLEDEEDLSIEELRALLEDPTQEEAQEVQPAEPAFDDPNQIHDPDETMIYRNFSNGYGREEEPVGQTQAKSGRGDAVDAALMFAASALALGITGVLIYWLVTYLS